jgi:hypothetical protein
MTYNTGNPIGSTDARDRSDNSENLDLAVNSLSKTFVDRLGRTRDTLEGIYQKSAYYRAGTFDAGYTLTNNRQTLAYGNVEYSWSGSFPKVVAAGSTPATSGGVGAGAWVDRTDVTLRSELLIGAIVVRNDKLALKNLVSINDYNPPSAAIDASAKLQQALNEGLNVDLSGRTIYLSSGVTMSTPGQMLFNGKIKTLDNFSSPSTDHWQIKITAADVLIDSIYFDANGLAGGAQDFSAYISNGVSACIGSIVGAGAHRLKITRSYFTRCNVAGSAIGLNGSDMNIGASAEMCTFEYNYGGGYFTQSKENSVVNCRVRKNNNAGVAFNTGAAYDGCVIGGFIEDCQYGGIALESGCYGISISGVNFKQTLFGQNDCSILVSSFVENSGSGYDFSITGCTFRNIKTDSTNDVSCHSIIMQGCQNINISGNTCDNGSGNNKFIFLHPIINSIVGVSVNNNVISGGFLGMLYTNKSDVLINEIYFKNNLIRDTSNFFYCSSCPKIGVQSTGIIFDGNAAPSSTGPILIGTGYSNPTYVFIGNDIPLWSSFGGQGLHALINTFGIRFADKDRIWQSNAAPNKLSWRLGDKVKNGAPAVGAPKGWVCTAEGTPGTWVSEGNL